MYPFRKEGTKLLAMVIGLRRDRALLNKVLRDVDWQEVAIPRKLPMYQKRPRPSSANKIEGQKGRIAALEEELRSLAKAHAG